MEFDVCYTLENEQQFWEELEEILSVQCRSQEHLDYVLRAYLSFILEHKCDYIKTGDDFTRCAVKLLESQLFAAQKTYVRMQMVSSVMQEDSADTLHILVAFLFCDGRQNENTFFLMGDIGIFSRLLALIEMGTDDETGLHLLMLKLIYEMSRIQQLRVEELGLISEESIVYLFVMIEELADHVEDSYHYPLVKLLLVLNEQYMMAESSSGNGNGVPLDETGRGVVINKVVHVLGLHGSTYKSFGSILILVLNRESKVDPSPSPNEIFLRLFLTSFPAELPIQLLILKLLFLLFTDAATVEYFYTNDLRVLVDVIIRNLLDLPAENISLRHTYLRVLAPLLHYTPLNQAPHYKRDELRRLIAIMGGEGSAGGHFESVDTTTKRLVARCGAVPWLAMDVSRVNQNAGLLGVEMADAMTSALSVMEITDRREKPGVHRNGTMETGAFVKPHGERTDMEFEGARSPFDFDDEA
ncbi:hypothetical protein MMC07_000498 [Pseudocyphellaria aurata]|nr:hypothetical protein [Pseudocyphellaria aurata]